MKYRTMLGAWLVSVVILAIEWVAGMNHILLFAHAGLNVISTVHLAGLLAAPADGEEAGGLERRDLFVLADILPATTPCAAASSAWPTACRRPRPTGGSHGRRAER